MYKLFDERSYLCRCLIKGCDVDDCISISIVITVVCKLPKTYLYLIYKCIIQFKYFSNKVTKVQTQILGINHRYFGFCPIISTFRQIFSNGANFWSLSYLITTIHGMQFSNDEPWFLFALGHRCHWWTFSCKLIL